MTTASTVATATVATAPAATATPAAPTIPDVANLPRNKKHWGTDIPIGFPALGDKGWHFSRHYYPPSANAAAALKNQFNAFLMWYESLAKPGSGGGYAVQNPNGEYVMTSRSFISGLGIQQFLNLVAFAEVDLQARSDGVEYDQRIAWYDGGKPVGMREDQINQTTHNLAATFGLERRELQLKASPKGSEAFLGLIEYHRSDGFLVKGSYESFTEIPDLDDIRALHFIHQARFVLTFEHHAALSAAKAEGLPQVLRDRHGHHIMVTSGGQGSIRYKSFLSVLKVLNPDIRILSLGDIDGSGLSVFAAMKFGTIASTYQNRSITVESAEYLHVPIATLIAGKRRMRPLTDKDEKEVKRLEVADHMDQNMARQVRDMRRTGKTSSLAAHRGHFVDDLCPIIEKRLSAPPPSTDNPDLSIAKPSLEPLASNYLNRDACLAELTPLKSIHQEDSSFEIKLGDVSARVEILVSSSTVMLTSLDDDDGERPIDLAELHSSVEKVKSQGFQNIGTTAAGEDITIDHLDRVRWVLEITGDVAMRCPDPIIANRASAVQKYHDCLSAAMSPLLSQTSEEGRVAEAILYMEIIWKEICIMVKGDRPFKCEEEDCAYSAKRAHNLDQHMRHVHSDVRPFECEEEDCAYSAKTKSTLDQHMRSIHSDARPFKCEEEDCAYSAKRQHHLDQHMRHVHSDVRLFECEEEDCAYSAKSQDALDSHMRHVHSDARPFECEEEDCAYSAKSKSALDSHMRHAHSDDRPFKCEEDGCTHSSKTKGALDAHKRNKHSDEVFECTQAGCEYSGNTKRKLVDHIASKHGPPKYFCEAQDCGANFTTKSPLNSHKKAHTGDTKFVCSISGCQASYNSKNALNLHQNKQHPADMFERPSKRRRTT
ncbi:unnamed protein product [Rhizoctonia solani]|uniref:C2H2-type domain-containing protein n=1 Tax=Rhizoctonia solani TaxID=456999 RepID=A0A8H3HSX6_9AGAM|nr:unnamed protein product [Rhizoctonia solani]